MRSLRAVAFQAALVVLFAPFSVLASWAPSEPRFLDEMPGKSLANPMSLHPWLYANGNPVANIDPQGTDVFPPSMLPTFRASVASWERQWQDELAQSGPSSPQTQYLRRKLDLARSHLAEAERDTDFEQSVVKPVVLPAAASAGGGLLGVFFKPVAWLLTAVGIGSGTNTVTEAVTGEEWHFNGTVTSLHGSDRAWHAASGVFQTIAGFGGAAQLSGYSGPTLWGARATPSGGGARDYDWLLGGDLQQAAEMAGQESRMGCGLACVRELLRRQGVEVSLEDLALEAMAGPEGVSTPAGLARALNAYSQSGVYKGGMLPEDPTAMGEPFIGLLSRRPFPTDKVGHFVIVESASPAAATISDPWGSMAPSPGPACRGNILLDRFLDLWGNQRHQGVARVGAKKGGR